MTPSRAILSGMDRRRSSWDVANFAAVGAVCGFISAALPFALSDDIYPLYPPASGRATLALLLLSTLAFALFAAGLAGLRNRILCPGRHRNPRS
jgi:hypothetical protein